MERTTEQIDKEIQELRETIQRLEEERQTYAGALEKAGDERKKVAFAAHGDKDAKAKERLTRARTVQRDAEFALADLESAIAEANAKLQTLQAEREASHRAEKKVELQKEIEIAVEEAKQTVPLIAAVVERVERYRERDLKIVGLAKEAGFENPAVFYSVKFLIRAIETRMDRKSYRSMQHLNDIFLERQVDEILRDFFAGRLDGKVASGMNGSNAPNMDASDAETEVGAEATA